MQMPTAPGFAPHGTGSDPLDRRSRLVVPRKVAPIPCRVSFQTGRAQPRGRSVSRTIDAGSSPLGKGPTQIGTARRRQRVTMSAGGRERAFVRLLRAAFHHGDCVRRQARARRRWRRGDPGRGCRRGVSAPRGAPSRGTREPARPAAFGVAGPRLSRDSRRGRGARCLQSRPAEGRSLHEHHDSLWYGAARSRLALRARRLLHIGDARACRSQSNRGIRGSRAGRGSLRGATASLRRRVHPANMALLAQPGSNDEEPPLSTPSLPRSRIDGSCGEPRIARTMGRTG
jgi:hypothetical protein